MYLQVVRTKIVKRGNSSSHNTIYGEAMNRCSGGLKIFFNEASSLPRSSASSDMIASPALTYERELLHEG